MTQDPSLPDVIRAAILNRQSDTHYALPGAIVAYDAAKQRATVQILVRRPETNEAGERVSISVAPLTNVPIVFPGSGPYSITWPLAKGDTVLVLFSESSLDKWLVSTGGQVDPLDNRRSSYSDAIAIPGLRTFRTPVASPGSGGMAIAAAAAMSIAATETTIASDSIKLGSAGASDEVMRKSDAQLFMTALANAAAALPPGTQGQAAVAAIIEALTGLTGVGWITNINSIVKAD